MSLRRTILVALAAAAALVAAPGPALAAEPPTILTAGFDAHDQLYATWSLAPGTTYSLIEFATLPVADPDLPEFFVDGQFATFDGCRRASCAGTTSFVGDAYPLKRDRRYFVKVAAKAATGYVTSAVWVIDETKPLIPGDAEIGEGDTNAPVAGKPFDGTGLIPPGVVPRVSFKLLKAPKTIRGLLRNGVGVRVTSSVAFAAQTELSTPAEIIGLRSPGFPTGGTRTVTATVDDDVRATFRALKRARVTLGVTIVLPNGTIKRAERKFTVRR